MMGGTICPPVEATASVAPGSHPRDARTNHQRDCESPGDHHVGGGRAGHGSEEGAGHDGDLGRPAAKPARQAEGEINEEMAGAGRLEDRTEQDEQEHVDGGRV